MLTDISGGSASILRPACFIPYPKDNCSNLTFCSAYPGVALHVCLSVQSVQDAATPPLIRPSLHRFLSSPLISSFNRAFRQFGGRWVTGDDVDGVGTKSWRVRMSRREGLWRSRNMAIEVVEVVQELKRTKGVEIKISAIMEGKGARLMKSDLLSVLEELQRQEFWFLALKVFDTILEEVWYQPDTSLFAKMIDCLGKCGEPQQAQNLFDRMVNEGLEPIQCNYTALIGAYCIVGNYVKGVELLRDMQLKGISPTGYTYERIMQGCKDGGASDLEEEMRREMEVAIGEFERKPIITRKK